MKDLASVDVMPRLRRNNYYFVLIQLPVQSSLCLVLENIKWTFTVFKLHYLMWKPEEDRLQVDQETYSSYSVDFDNIHTVQVQESV